MIYYAYISDRCKEDARRHSKMAEVEELARKLEKDQSIANLKPFDNNFKGKDFGRDFRLIIGIKYYDEECVLVLWRLYSRGDNEYYEFYRSPEKFLPDFNKEVSDNKLESWLNERKGKNEVKALPELSEEEKRYIYGVTPEGDFISNLVIYESKDWVDEIKENLREYGANIHEAVFILCEDILKYNISAEKVDFIQNGFHIIFKLIRTGRSQALFLAGIAHSGNKKKLDEIRSKYLDNEKVTNEEEYKRKAIRAYPVEVVWDQNIWIKNIEFMDETANMALSSEESDILNSVTGIGYPLFINGRPGSGKSTVLQYVFSEHIMYYLLNRPCFEPPLYLTYNQELLGLAREIVENILKCNANKVERLRNIDKKFMGETLDKSFVSFRDFMVNLVREYEELDTKRYVDFPRFKHLFNKQKFRTCVTPEVSWHVIRTYVKGFVCEKDLFLTPDDYRNLARKRKSVDLNTFDRVYNDVWDKWYKSLANDGYWDDQDLARKVLELLFENRLKLSAYPAIFCDEAQDFTHNELRLILQLSLFSRRRLRANYINKIPFAFAGDPFQTLNPTGFDWEATKAKFHENIIQLLCPTDSSKFGMNWKELDFNYRSNNGIVLLCNIIHLLRGVAFKKKSLNPQKAYFEFPTNVPFYFEIDNPICQTKLKEQAELVIIIPCQEGEEENYIKNDDFLKGLAFPEREDSKITRNILSPIKAKGLEFNRVVLYKFGDVAVKENGKLIDLLDGKIDQLDDEESIQLEYFINRLYVASSRARKRLIIVDTKEGINNFWKKYFENSSFIQNLVNIYKQIDRNAEWKTDNLILIQPGDKQLWESDQDSPEELAKQFYTQGLAQRDILKLQYARDNFRRAKKEDKAIECEALIYEYEEKKREAGKLFIELTQYEKALRLFWESKAWDQIAEKDIWKGRPEFKSALYMLEPDNFKLDEKIELLKSFASNLKEGILVPDEKWGEIIARLAHDIYEEGKKYNIPKYQWQSIFNNVQDFSTRGFQSHLNSVLLNIGMMKNVYPENIEILFKNDHYKDILDEFEKNKPVQLDERQSYLVLSAALKMNDFDKGLDILRSYLTEKNLLKTISWMIGKGEDYFSTKITQLFDLIVQKRDLSLALSLVNGSISQAESEDLRVFQDFKPHKSIDCYFIEYLAESDLLPSLEKSVLYKISDYLRKRLIEKSAYYQNYLNVAQAGAALERAGMVKYCLEFYEKVIDQNKEDAWKANEEEILFAKLRWLVCKNRNYDLAKSTKRQQEILREIKDKRVNWGIMIDLVKDQPEYPKIGKSKPARGIREDERKPDINVDIKLEVDKKRYEVELLKEKGKVRIKESETKEIITLEGKTMEIKSDDDEFKQNVVKEVVDNRSVNYHISRWNISCTIKMLNENKWIIEIYAGSRIAEVISLIMPLN